MTKSSRIVRKPARRVYSAAKTKNSEMRRKRNERTDNKASAETRKRIENVTLLLHSKRIIGIRIVDICRMAKIAIQTFYGYFFGASDVLQKQELAIEERFLEAMPKEAKREVAFRSLLIFIIKERSYFSITLKMLDMYLLSRLLHRMRPLLVGDDVDDLTYNTYVGALMTVVSAWRDNHNFSKDTIEEYTRRLMRVRIQKWETDV